jgi:hypothetical protein
MPLAGIFRTNDDTKRVYNWQTEEEVGIGKALTETLLCRVVCQEFS